MSRSFLIALAIIAVFSAGLSCRLSAADVRLTNDNTSYVSAYQIGTGTAVTNDAVINECSLGLGRQNEPAVAFDPRNPNVLIGSSNDYCGVYASTDSAGNPTGPIWLGYYRSEDGGANFQSSLVPGYPGDPSPYAALAHIRTASAGDPVVAWDGHGRVFLGAEASDDPAGTKKTFGDVWVATFDNPTEGTAQPDAQQDGKRFAGASIVARGSSAPNLLGKFHDKDAIQADRTGGACDGNVYYSWTRFNGGAGEIAIYFSRSTDHGATWSTPAKLSAPIRAVQDSDISVTANGHVYVTFREYAFLNGQTDAVDYVRSTDCGRTFAPPQRIATLLPADTIDISDPQPVPTPSASAPQKSAGKSTDPAASSNSGRFSSASLNVDCGDFADHCLSGFTYFRRDSDPRSIADQGDTQHEYVYIVYAATRLETLASTGSSYGTVIPGLAGQSAVYFVRLDGATGAATTPALIDDESVGHQFFAAIAAEAGKLHVIWWDSRNDPNYDPLRPVGNDAAGNTGPALDVFGTVSTDRGATWATPTRVSSVTTSPNWEQFDDRTVPFGGDYLWVTASGASAFTTWTDWRNTTPGPDPRESTTGQDDNDSADVAQCRTFNAATGAWSPDTCPHSGGLDQNIYGASAP